MDDKRLPAAQAMASVQGRDWATLSDDAKAIYLDLAGAALSATTPPPKPAAPEPRPRALRGVVEIWTVRDGRRGARSCRCEYLAEARKITAGWSRGSDWEPGSGLPTFEFGPQDPEPRDGDENGYYISQFWEDETGRRVSGGPPLPKPQEVQSPEDMSAQWHREMASFAPY